jgi:hypothetical protein
MTTKNTLQRGSVRYIVFKDDGVWYAVALEFNIVESGDDPREVLVSLFEAVKGYVKSARKIKARPNCLNQKADQEYEAMWERLKNTKNDSRVKMSDIFTFGRQPLASVV